MIQSYITQNRILLSTENRDRPGIWLKVTAPTELEAQSLAEEFNLDEVDILSAMDREEKTRIEFQDENCMIVFDIPTIEVHHDRKIYNTIPMVIFLTPDDVLTICSEETSVLQSFENRRVKEFSTKKRLRFVYQIMMQTAMYYQECLKKIEKRRQELEERIGDSLEENDLICLHELESTLVYFATSLRENNNILSRLTRYKRLEQYEEDRDLLDDTIVETQQAIEMTQIYRDIIDGTEQLMSTIINNRLNNIMKILTSITIILSIPTLISGLYGMNVSGIPLATLASSFWVVCLIIVLICIVTMFILRKKDLL